MRYSQNWAQERKKDTNMVLGGVLEYRPQSLFSCWHTPNTTAFGSFSVSLCSKIMSSSYPEGSQNDIFFCLLLSNSISSRQEMIKFMSNLIALQLKSSSGKKPLPFNKFCKFLSHALYHTALKICSPLCMVDSQRTEEQATKGFSVAGSKNWEDLQF